MVKRYNHYVIVIVLVCFITISLTLHAGIVLSKEVKDKEEAVTYLQENHIELYNNIESTISKFNDKYNPKEINKLNNVEISLEAINNIETFSNKLANYLSNVNGKIISINKNRIEEGGHMASAIYFTNPSSGILPISVSGTKKDKVTFIIEVPQDAPYKEYLQDILDGDFRQIQKDIRNGKVIK